MTFTFTPQDKSTPGELLVQHPKYGPVKYKGYFSPEAAKELSSGTPGPHFDALIAFIETRLAKRDAILEV